MSNVSSAVSAKLFIIGGSEEEKFDHPTQKPVELMRRPILKHLRRGESFVHALLGFEGGTIKWLQHSTLLGFLEPPTEYLNEAGLFIRRLKRAALRISPD